MEQFVQAGVEVFSLAGIIIVFPKLDNAKGIKNLLVRRGYMVNGICTSGSQAMSMVDEMGEGIVVCGYKYSDMTYMELKEYLPRSFEMLLVASQEKLRQGYGQDMMCLQMPLKVQELADTIEMLEVKLSRRKRKEKKTPKPRQAEEQKYIDDAKLLLMGRNHFSEEEAHRYIQKMSMDSGNNMVETSRMILDVM